MTLITLILLFMAENENVIEFTYTGNFTIETAIFGFLLIITFFGDLNRAFK